MFDTFGGLPLHPLILHLYVVLGPLVALTAIAFAVRPRWRVALRWPTAVGAAVTGVVAFVTKESGEALRGPLGGGGALIERHAAIGDVTGTLGIVFGLVALGGTLLLWRPDRELPAVASIALTVLMVAAALAVLVAVILAGHSGAVSVWT